MTLPRRGWPVERFPDLAHNMVMIRVNIFELKARLSEYLKRVDAGEHVVICRHNTPMATLTRVAEARLSPRVVGPMHGAPAFEVAGSFFEPLPDEELAAWEGREPALPLPSATPRKRSSRAHRPAPRAAKRTRKTSRRRA